MSRAQLTSTVEQNTGGAVAPYVAGKNAIINGGMDFFQRSGTPTTGINTAAATFAYTLDRLWVYSNGPAVTTSQQVTGDTTNLPNIQYCARLQRQSGQTATTATVWNFPLETKDSIRFAGQVVTISFYARKSSTLTSGSSFSGVLYSGTGTDQNGLGGFTGQAGVASTYPTITTTWARYTATGTVSASATELRIELGVTWGSGTAGANDYVEVTGVQLEIGSVATPFSRAGGTLSGELEACQRYYQRWTATAANAPIVNGCYYSSIFHAVYPFKVTMRTTPSMNASSYSQWYINAGTTYYNPGGSLGFGVITPDTTEFYVATTSSPSGGTAGYLYAGLNSYVEMSAEL